MVRQEREARPQEEPKREFVVTPETANLVAAVGNNEAKAITLGVMTPGSIYSRRDLHRRILEVQGGAVGWRMGHEAPFGYCGKSLSPIGLVAREVIDSYLRTYGYIITEYGEKTGKALAGHLLKWSLDHPNFSLYKMFGSTHSRYKPKEQEELGEYKRRSPEMRVKILWELITNPQNNIREADLVEELEVEDNTLFSHLIELSRNGAIGYEAVEHGKPYTYYKFEETIPDREPEPVRKRKNLTYEVYEILRGKPATYYSIDDIVNILIRRYPNKYKREKTNYHNVSGVTSSLEKQGFVSHKKFKKDVRSSITLSEEQRETIASLIEIIDRFQGKDERFLAEGRRLVSSILADPKSASALLRKAKEASPYVAQLPSPETSSLILSLLRKTSSLTTREIQGMLYDQFDKRLGRRRLRVLLTHLLEQGEVKVEKTKAGNVYSIVEG